MLKKRTPFHNLSRETCKKRGATIIRVIKSPNKYRKEIDAALGLVSWLSGPFACKRACT